MRLFMMRVDELKVRNGHFLKMRRGKITEKRKQDEADDLGVD